MKNYTITLAFCAVLMACGSSKSMQNATTSSQTTESTTSNDSQSSKDYIRKVNDNAVYSKDIVSDIDFKIDAMGKKISLDGKLQMRRDECIRITITPFGLMEAARLEFTPTYVLIMNRMGKEYVKATYGDVDFLKNNGLDFYTLQSLFWNELFQPGKKRLNDSDLGTFSADMSVNDNRPIMLKVGKFEFNWKTDVSRALINKCMVSYGKGTSEASTMSFEYGDFVPVGSKKFPSKISLSFNSKVVNKGKMSLSLTLDGISNDSDWDAQTSVSDKYKSLTAEDMLKKIINM